MAIDFQLDPAHSRATLGGEPHVFHCHHYNCFLQHSLIDQAGTEDVTDLMVGPAAQVVLSQLAAIQATRETAEELFRILGFGRIDLSGLTADGGDAVLRHSHYAQGWIAKFGGSGRPVCFMASGFAEGVARHLFGGDFQAREIRCVATGAHECRIRLERGGGPRAPSPGLGKVSPFPPRAPSALRTQVDESAIIAACGRLPLTGDADGTIQAFGVSLTRHYANYYNLLSYPFEQRLEKAGGTVAAERARALLIEAGKVCAFHTFGGIMESAEWDALIKPQCHSREDWAYGMVAVVNALGWGRWSIAGLDSNRLELVIDGSYESNGYLRLYGRSAHPRCYLATGGAAGLMNLLYNADVTTRPDLTPAFYERTFRNKGHFVAREVECRTQGAPACRVVAERS